MATQRATLEKPRYRDAAADVGSSGCRAAGCGAGGMGVDAGAEVAASCLSAMANGSTHHWQ